MALISFTSIRGMYYLCIDQELPTAKRVHAWDAQQQKKLVQCSGIQGHICNYNIT